MFNKFVLAINATEHGVFKHQFVCKSYKGSATDLKRRQVRIGNYFAVETEHALAYIYRKLHVGADISS